VNGEKVPELFIVDLPLDENGWKQPGDAPLEGTDMTMPAPPSGICQRRLTFTHERVFPGLVNQPRHWVRSNPKASEIAFLMRDDSGIVQLWLISPQGGAPRQLTQCTTNIQSALNWHPSGKWLGFVLENRIACCDVQTGEIDFLTERHGNPPSADAIVFSPDGRQVAWMEDVEGFRQLWLSSLFSTRDLTELSLRKRSHGSNTVSSTAVKGISRIASDLVPQFVSLSLIIVALARVPGYVPSLPPVCDMMLEQPLTNAIPLHIVSVTNIFLIIIYSSVFIVFAW